MLRTQQLTLVAASIALVGCEAGNGPADAPTRAVAAPTETDPESSEPSPSAPSNDDGINGKPTDGASAQLDVRVLYLERMMVPPSAEVLVVLEDQAIMDVAAEKIAEARVPAQGGPPYAVTLDYDPTRLTPRGRYGVRARIENQGQLMFTSTEFTPAFGTDGRSDSEANDPVEIIVRRVRSRPEPGFAASLTGTTWTLVELDGKPAGKGAGGKAPNITLQGSESRVSGFGGCNRLMGGYELEGDEIAFPKLAMTMMACVDGMDLEKQFSAALGKTSKFAIEGNTLTFFTDDGTAVAKFKSGD